ncbi:MAG: stage IV sporulation protein A [Ruminococcaceae bacterium]|nr:stage IV sporulation protein A [Oscillospiraceae bacterium]
MDGYNIYQDISTRTGGDIYIGVVGPVRTGKSTFIKRFMDLLVIPHIDNAFKRERARDELPQSAAGKTIMTTEPKFIPNEAVNISLSDGASFNVRMIDCVGYIVDSALGHIENEVPRMVKTPWYNEEIPFAQAAELGTKKVISDHSTIGLVVTTDGSISDIPREDYTEAESRVITELKTLGKPFVVLLNCMNPSGERAQAVKAEIESRHGVSVLPVNCQQLEADDINAIIEQVLFEFPLQEIAINIPDWIDVLSSDHWLKKGIYDNILASISDVHCIREVKTIAARVCEYENVASVDTTGINLGEGTVKLELHTDENLFYKILGEQSGFEIDGKDTLIELMTSLSQIKREYDKVSYALKEVAATGYGIVSPTIDELSLEEPEIVKQGNRFGVRLRASAPSIHMIRADIETEVSPLVGTEKQSEELVHYLLQEFDQDPKQIWQSNIFGKSLHELVSEGLHNKLYRMPEDAQYKLQETLQKIINEGSGGLICIIL